MKVDTSGMSSDRQRKDGPHVGTSAKVACGGRTQSQG